MFCFSLIKTSKSKLMVARIFLSSSPFCCGQKTLTPELQRLLETKSWQNWKTDKCAYLLIPLPMNMGFSRRWVFSENCWDLFKISVYVYYHLNLQNWIHDFKLYWMMKRLALISLVMDGAGLYYSNQVSLFILFSKRL